MKFNILAAASSRSVLKLGETMCVFEEEEPPHALQTVRLLTVWVTALHIMELLLKRQSDSYTDRTVSLLK